MTIAQLAKQVADRVIGRASGPLSRRRDPAGESTLGDVVADAVQAGAAPFCLNIATLISPEQLRGDLGDHPRHPGHPGEITVRAALHALPLTETSTTVLLTGEALHQALEQQFDHKRRLILQVSQQISYRYALNVPAGQHIDPASITIGGKVVNPASTYRISVGDSLRGPDGIPALQAAQPIPAGITGVGGAGNGTLFDLFAAYLTIRNPLPVPAGGRITRSDS